MTIKNIAFVLFLSSTLTSAMKTEFAETSCNIDFYGTKINLTHNSTLESNNIDAMVIGYEQQLLLQKPFGERKHYLHKVGDYTFQNNYIVYEKDNKISNSRIASIVERTVRCEILIIEEPYLKNIILYDDHHNKIVRPAYNSIINNRNNTYQFQFYDDEAVQKAYADLTSCYTRALKKIVKKLGKLGSKKKRITLPTLGIDFPEDKSAVVAIESISNFIKEHQKTLDCIKLIVEKECFLLYKRLLIEKCGPIQNIILLYCAHEDCKHLLYFIPKEIIDCIVLDTVACYSKNLLTTS